MPTGYTDKILNGCSFEEFVWAVARGFGALIMLRDDNNAPIPKKFEPDSYHLNRCEEAKKEVCRLSELTNEQLRAEYDDYFKKFQEDRQLRIERNADTFNKYTAMRDRVVAWTPPTSDHKGIKDFMLKQIDESIKFDVVEEEYFPAFQDYEAWVTEKRERSKKDVSYHKEQYQKECQRTTERNAWIEALRNSLKDL